MGTLFWTLVNCLVFCCCGILSTTMCSAPFFAVYSSTEVYSPTEVGSVTTITSRRRGSLHVQGAKRSQRWSQTAACTVTLPSQPAAAYSKASTPEGRLAAERDLMMSET